MLQTKRALDRTLKKIYFKWLRKVHNDNLCSNNRRELGAHFAGQLQITYITRMAQTLLDRATQEGGHEIAIQSCITMSFV